jgi:nucleoside-diphosphate kinase
MTNEFRSFVFVMIKPDAMKKKLTGEIISRFEEQDFDIIAMKCGVPSRNLIEKLYNEHSKKDFFTELVEYICEDRVCFIWFGYKKENGVEVARNLIGESPPNEKPGTIRGDYATDFRRNAVHASDSNESAMREIELIFPEGNLVK